MRFVPVKRAEQQAVLCLHRIVYLRTLLIHGTPAVLARVAEKPDRLSRWSRALIARRGYRRAAVALAAKNAPMLWALMRHGTTYQLQA